MKHKISCFLSLQLDKEVLVKVNEKVVVIPGGESIILSDDSTNIPIDTSMADDGQGQRRLTSDKAHARGMLRILQLFLICSAIFSVAMGLTVAMHSYFTVCLFQVPLTTLFTK